MMDFLVSSLHSCRLCAIWPESQRRICRSTLRCYHSSSFSACPFFDCLRLFPVVLLWIGRPILSRAHTISVYAALQLPGDLRTVLYALRWFLLLLEYKKVTRLTFDARHCDNIAFVVSLSCNVTLKIMPSSANALLGQRLKNVWSLHFDIAGDFVMALCHLYE